MGTLTMTPSEREAFLAGLHIGVLAVERADGPPVVAPIWYRYSAGGAVEFNIDESSVKAALLAAAGRATMCVQQEALPYAYVTVEGPVEMDPTTPEVRLDIATRYLGSELAEGYMSSEGEIDAVLVRLRPERWRTTDYAKLTMPT